MRKPVLSAVEVLEAAYEAKARAELADADAIVSAPVGTWDGPVVGAATAFLVAHPVAPAPAPILAERTADAVARAAEALGAAGRVFVLVTRPGREASAEQRARRVRIAVEAVDAPAVIALDAESAEDLAAAFALNGLRAGTPVRAFGRSLGAVGDFVASLEDDAAKARSWSAMKAIAAQAGLKAKGRPKAPPAKPEPGAKATDRD